MKAVEITYRYETLEEASRERPADADAARRRLDEGSRAFASLLSGLASRRGTARRVIHVDAQELGLADGVAGAPAQRPFAAVLGCSDARVPVELIFNEGPNDLFVVRVAGNVAGAEETASLEFGTIVLGAKLLMVLGHSNCGAVKAALEGTEVPGQISTLYRLITPGIDRQNKNVDAAVAANVRAQVKVLRDGSTVISGLIRDGKLKLVGGMYDLNSGKVTVIEG